MKVLGLIAEYNPFHNGHKYHLEKSLEKTSCDYSIAVMSGSFVQRGEPSFINKWTKAKTAIDNGVDLVIELPTLYSTQSAELFASGAIEILNSMNIVDFISFGSETGKLEPLEIISEILSNEPKDFKDNLEFYLSLGNSFPKSRSLALESFLKRRRFFHKYDFKSILNMPNNILGIEYLKALQKTNSNIKAFTLERVGSGYKDSSINNEFASATGIRNLILNKNIDSIKDLIPFATYLALKDYVRNYKHFNKIGNYGQVIKYLILTKNKEELKKIFDIDEGLENRIRKQIRNDDSVSDIITNISTKRYPYTRIQRIFMHLLLGLDSEGVKNAYINKPNYIRILGSNKKGFKLINEIKEKSDIEVITKFSNYNKLKIESINTFLSFEEKATNIYFLGLGASEHLDNMDYLTTPYIKS